MIDRIKDKFREWEKYKIETVDTFMKTQFAERKKSQILNIKR